MRSLDPELCPKCFGRAWVKKSRPAKLGYRRRRHVCGTCGHRWNSYQSLVNPKRYLKKLSRR